FFFFSSRRRHTRSDRDWSSDVCSSDLMRMMKDCIALAERAGFLAPQAIARADLGSVHGSLGDVERGHELVRIALDVATKQIPMRSEERRVGKEGRTQLGPEQ